MNNPLKAEPKPITPSDMIRILCESWGFALHVAGEIYHHNGNVETLNGGFSLFNVQDGHELRFNFDECEAKVYADGLIELTSRLKQKFKFLVLQELRVKEFIEKRWW